MDAEVREGAWLRRASPAMLASAALVIEVANLAIPWFGGGSTLSFVLSDGVGVHLKLAHLVSIFAITIVIGAGLWMLRRGAPVVAAGLFIAIGLLLAIRVLSGLASTIEGWVWQTFVVLGLQTIEAVLLFLAASRARREGTAS